MSKKIAIVGAGGHGKVVGEIALLNKFKTIDFFDDYTMSDESKFPFPVIGTCRDLKNILKKYNAFFVAIGDNKIRSKKMEWLSTFDVDFVNLFHPNSTVSQYSSLGSGICIMAHAVINAGAFIGNGAIINTSASIDHDCVIENYAHISPGCSLSGSVKVGKFSLIGTGSSVHPSIEIGQNVKIGVGSKIFKNISDHSIFKN
jgi:sugar O-acyltransferase (sialic acid O-acetyltransferase NeuD family)